MTSAEASAMDGVVETSLSVGGTKVDENSMDWEITDEVSEENSAPTAQNVVSKVPDEEDRVQAEDLDLESFSFESNEEEETDKACLSEIGTSLRIEVLQTTIEASADALDIVTGKDVVMIAGKTGKLVRKCLIIFQSHN